MKVTILRRTLTDLLRAAAPAVASRTTIPAMTCFKLEAGAGLLTATATDGSIYARASGAVLEGSSLKSGVSVVSAAFLLNAVKSAPDGDIELSSDDKAMTVKVPGSKWKVPQEDADTFPDWSRDQSEPVAAFDVPAPVLCGLLERAQVGTNQKETSEKFLTTAVLLEGDESGLAAAGSDSRRLSAVVVPMAGAKGMYALLPRQGVGAILTAFAAVSGSVRVTLQPGRFLVAGDGVEVGTQLMAGRFVPWKEVIRQNPKYHRAKLPNLVRLVADPESLLGAVRRAALTADDNDSAIRWEIGDGVVRLSLVGTAGESAVEHEPLELDPAAPKTHVGLFPNCTTQFLAAAVGDKVSVAFGDDKTGVLFEQQFAGGNWKYLEMPLVR